MGKRRARPDRPPIVHWVGDREAAHSLAHVNREVVDRLIAGRRVRIADPGQNHPAVTVRHQWPPDLTRPERGAWVMVQPWEFGGLPAPWIAPMRDEVDEVWCYTTFVRDRYLEAGVDPDRLVLTPLGVDGAAFHPGRPTSADDGRFRFLFVGGTIARKGIDVLLEAWVRAFPTDDGATSLVVKGSPAAGAYAGSSIAGDLARLRERHPGAAPIEHVDADLPHAEVAALYRACDALVHPYRGEGFGLPVAEAMASGLPVLVTGRGATADFCSEETAFLIPSERRLLGATPHLPPAGPEGYWLEEPDLDALVDLLRHVRHDTADAARRADAGRRFVAEHLTWERTAAIVEDRLLPLARAPRREGPALRLSACLIVKDEAALLPGCLASLEGVVDEVVVHDTGSSDDTVAIARAAGATVVEGTWDDDFGAARNVALEACRGDWVLHIDADERIAAGVDGAALRAALASPSTADVLGVTIDNIHADGTSGTRHQGMRLFRRTRARWVGRLHEQVVARTGQANLRRGRTDLLALDHLGYQAEHMAARGKAERNVRLAEADLADAPHHDRAALLLNLARSLTVAGRHDEAARRCDEAAAEATTSPEVRTAVAHHAAELAFTAGRPADARPWVERLRDATGDSTLADFLEASAAALLGEPAPWLADLPADAEVWNEVAGVAVAADLVHQRRVLALQRAGRWGEALAADRAVAVHLLALDPDAADPIVEGLWADGPAPEVIGLAVHHGARLPAARALEWSARIRAAGLAARCPLVGRALADGVDGPERIRCAAVAASAFADDRAEQAAVVAAATLGDDDVLPVLVELDELAPALLPAVVGALARRPERRDALHGALVALGAQELAEEILAGSLRSPR
jgi:glycosyltransferase involved in cell wall biosynthesis